MGCDWHEYRLGEVTRWTSGGTPSKKIESYWNGDIPWISASSMYGNRYKNSKLKITSNGLKTGSRLASKGSILLLVRGSMLHQKIPVGIAETDVSFNQDVKAIMGIETIDLQWFLLFWFMSNEAKLLNMVENTGIGAGKLDTKLLQDMRIHIPPLKERQTIVLFLKALDDKIELNRQMNATLEGMAQALFKSWFVDFDPVIDNALAAGNPIPEAFAARTETRRKALADGAANRDVAKQFPVAFQFTEEMGWIPEGWKVSRLHTLIDLIGGGTPKTSVDEYWNGSIPWFSVVDAPNNSDVFVIDTDKKITELGLEQSSTKILREGSTIISARGTVGKCALVGKEMAMNQSCYGIHGANGIADIYTYYTIRQFVSDLQHRGHGSVFNTITRDTFQSIYVPFGKVELTRKFDQDVNPLLKRIRFNLCHNTELTNLRDTLLPKLISGEIRIPEAEKITEEALA